MRRLQDKNEQAMANPENMASPENKSNEVTGSPQDGDGLRDDRVRRLSRLAGAKDAPPLAQAAPPDIRALKPGGREAEAKEAVEPALNPGPATVDAPKKSPLRPLM